MWTRSISVCEKHNLSVRAVEWSRRGFPCVLLHGFGDNASVWSHLAPRLMSRFRTVALDLRGHGNSDWDPEARYDAETFTGDLTKVIAKLGFERTILIGHSWGAAMALRFAAVNPTMVAALVIIDFGPELAQAGVDEVIKGFVEMPRSFASTEEFSRWLAARRPLADPRLLDQFARYSLQQCAGGECKIKSDAALGTKSELSRLKAKGGRCCFPELWVALARIKCQSLVIRGAASGVFPRDVATRMVERTRVSQLQTISGAGHSVVMDNPLEFSTKVDQFLTNTFPFDMRNVFAPR
jgi:pimeloyl-ACP methyl ester carboxylesterase